MSANDDIPQFSTKVVPAKSGDGAYIEVTWRSKVLPRTPKGELRQRKLRVGPAWHYSDGRRRKGAPLPGYFLEGARATDRAAEQIVRMAEADSARELSERARATRSFRRMARSWLAWQECKDAKPTYLQDVRYMLAEPGQPHRRGTGTYLGRIMATFGDRDPATITESDVNRFLASQDFSPRNFNKHRALLHRIFAWAIRDGASWNVTSNPVSHTVKRQEPLPRRESVYDEDEVLRIAEAFMNEKHRKDHRSTARFPGARDAALTLFLFYTGLRIGEARALERRQFDDLDAPRPLLYVTAGVSAGVRTSPKSNQSRVLGLTPQAVAAVRLAIELSGCRRDGDLLFPGFGEATYMDGSAFARRFRRARIAAGVPDRESVHGLRRASGTAIAKTLGVGAARDWLGHSDVKVTDRYVTGADVVRDADAVSRAFGGKADGAGLPAR